jgi:SAM-dependent methyltransferase
LPEPTIAADTRLVENGRVDEAGKRRRVSRTQLLIGVEGLAMLRHYGSWDVDELRARLPRVAALCAADLEAREVVEVDPAEGYAVWAASYDETEATNPMVSMEEPPVRSLIERLPPGRAVDAGCGSGRHSRLLLDLGHDVVGVDASVEMLGLARTRAPRAALVLGSLAVMPVADEVADLVVCGLALAHLPEVGRAISELARITRPGGRVIISDVHPIPALLGAHVLASRDDGTSVLIRNHFHPHGTYLAAFARAGLAVRGCMEPPYTERELELQQPDSMDVWREAVIGTPGVLIWNLERVR